MFHLFVMSWNLIDTFESTKFSLPSSVLPDSEYVIFIPFAMLLPSVHRSLDVGGLNIDGPPPENPPFMAIITTLAKIPIAANIPVATKIVLFGLISYFRYCKTLKKIKRKDYWTVKSNWPDSTKVLGAPDA